MKVKMKLHVLSKQKGGAGKDEAVSKGSGTATMGL